MRGSGTADKNMAKKDFFKLVVLAVVLNQPPFMVSALYEKDPEEMYIRAEADLI